MTRASYLLDSNVFMEASRRYYAFDLVPRFWECLEQYAQSGQIQSIDRVKEELDKGKDRLAEWASQNIVEAFKPTDAADVIDVFRKIMAWVQGQEQFTDAAKAEFAACADGWLVAYAAVHGLIVVTHETYAPNIRIRVKIPNVCKAFGVPYVDTFAMLRDLEIKLG